MWALLDRLAIVLFDATLSAAAFLTFIVLATLACRQPARRILLARVALLSSLAIIPLVGFGRLPRLDVLDTFVESPFFPKILFAPADPDRAQASDETPPLVLVTPEALGIRRVPEWLFRAEAFAAHWLPRGLTFLDMACVAAGSFWLILGLAGAHWLIRRSRPPSEATSLLFARLIEGRPAARAVLRVCTRLKHPVVTGLFRATILIPEALDSDEVDRDLLRLSLLHEIAHAERSDHWFSSIAGMAQSVWFFLPQVWWLRAQLAIDQEFLADRSAAERFGTSSDYASSLLSMAAPVTQSAAVLEPAGRSAEVALIPETIGSPSPLFQRMLMLLHCPYPVESRTPRLWSWTSRVAVVVASIAAACLVFRWPHSSFALPAGTPGPASTASARQFRVAQFVAKPIEEPGSPPRSAVYVLPLELPAAYDLQVELYSTQQDLAQVRIAGHRLAGAAQPASTATSTVDPSGTVERRLWHHIHMRRDPRGIRLTVDQEPVALSSAATPSFEWLTIEPPARSPIEFRNLVVSW